MSLGDWSGVEARIEKIVAESPEPFAPATVQNALEFAALARSICPAPDEIAKGYWPTISISWPNLEFEIFDDRIEVYRFGEGRTDIRHDAHSPGSPFSAALIADLPRLT